MSFASWRDSLAAKLRRSAQKEGAVTVAAYGAAVKPQLVHRVISVMQKIVAWSWRPMIACLALPCTALTINKFDLSAFTTEPWLLGFTGVGSGLLVLLVVARLVEWLCITSYLRQKLQEQTKEPILVELLAPEPSGPYLTEEQRLAQKAERLKAELNEIRDKQRGHVNNRIGTPTRRTLPSRGTMSPRQHVDRKRAPSRQD